MSFKKAIEAQAHKGKTFTENGAVVRKSSGTDVLNLFTKIGSMRNTPDSEKARMFHKAYHEDADLTVRMLLWVRDVLQGAGERQTFRVLLKELENLDKDLAKRLIPKIPELGRWDDLFAYDTPSIQKEAMGFYYKALKNKNSLAAKWAPREASARKEWAERLRAVTGLTPKQYRKMLVELTDVVETKMCDNKWKEINFSHVPSVAMSIYNRAFMKHLPKEFSEFSEKAVNGDKQLTASQKHGIIYQDEFIAENGRVMVVMKNPEILKKVRPNDFVISMRSFQGGLELSPLEGSISSAYVMLKPDLSLINTEYFKYLFKTPRYIQSLQSTSNLIRDGQALRFNNFSQVKLVLPPKSEQQEIVEYLDKEKNKIDNLTYKQKSLIEKLKEYRTSIISHAVTGKIDVREFGA